MFFHNPKCAGTSIKTTIETELGNSECLGLEKLNIASILESFDYGEFKNFFRCIIVRNPWQRILSWYIKKREKIAECHSSLIYPFNYTFRDFIEKYLCNSSIAKCKDIYKNQFDLIYNKNGRFIVNYIGKFESIDSSWNDIAKMVGIKHKLLYLNKNRFYSLEDYYDQRTKLLINRYYEKDVKYFGYQF